MAKSFNLIYKEWTDGCDSMVNNSITVEDLNKKYTKEDQKYVERITQLKIDIGIINGSYTSGRSNKNFNIPFSKYYNTLQEFIRDQDKAHEILIRNGSIPENLYKKLKETVKELNETYGPGDFW